MFEPYKQGTKVNKTKTFTSTIHIKIFSNVVTLTLSNFN